MSAFIIADNREKCKREHGAEAADSDIFYKPETAAREGKKGWTSAGGWSIMGTVRILTPYKKGAGKKTKEAHEF